MYPTPHARRLNELKRQCHFLRAKIWDMDNRRERFESHRWIQGHIGESLTTATVEELTRLAGYLKYKLEHGHCPLHEEENSKVRYKRLGGSRDARVRIREKLVEMFGEKCAVCGKHDVPLTLDHIKPIALGGKNELGNTQLLCLPCHEKKTRTDSRIAYRKFFAEKFPEKHAKRQAERRVHRAAKNATRPHRNPSAPAN